MIRWVFLVIAPYVTRFEFEEQRIAADVEVSLDDCRCLALSQIPIYDLGLLVAFGIDDLLLVGGLDFERSGWVVYSEEIVFFLYRERHFGKLLVVRVVEKTDERGLLLTQLWSDGMVSS